MTWIGVANSGELLYTTGDNGLVDYSQITGDVQGVIDGTVVTALQGTAINAVAPTTSGELLEFDGTEWSVVGAPGGTTHRSACQNHI